MITKERAEEIMQQGSRWSNWSKFCTPEEDAYIMQVWKTMPGYTCWWDALNRIRKGEDKIKPSKS